ncbi:hypothetical protein [Holospora obtusa]|nr:hypothetical protein [Holospora obtusa]
MKILFKGKSKLFFIVFIMHSFYAYAGRYQQTEQTAQTVQTVQNFTSKRLVLDAKPEEHREFELLKQRITIRIKDIISNAITLLPSQAHTLKLKESEIYKNIPIILENIRKKFGLSGLIAYEHSVAQFWCSFETNTPNGYGGIEPKTITHVIQAFSKNAGLDVSLELSIDTEAHSTFLDKELEILFSSFEDEHSKGVKNIIKEEIQQEKSLSEYDISKILRDSFSSTFLANPKSTIIKENFQDLTWIAKTWTWTESFYRCIYKNIQKRREHKINHFVVVQASRDRSEISAIEERYKEERDFTIDASSAYKQFLLSTITDKLLDLQRIYGDSSLVVFNCIEQESLWLQKIPSDINSSFDLEDKFEFWLERTKMVMTERMKNDLHSPYQFGWDLSCLFAHRVLEKFQYSENEEYLGSLMYNINQLKQVGFSEEQLTRILKSSFEKRNSRIL